MERPDKRIKSDANSLWHKIIQASEEEAINKCIDIFNRLVQNSAQVGAFLAIRKVATRKQKKEEERKRTQSSSHASGAMQLDRTMFLGLIYVCKMRPALFSNQEHRLASSFACLSSS